MTRHTIATTSQAFHDYECAMTDVHTGAHVLAAVVGSDMFSDEKERAISYVTDALLAHVLKAHEMSARAFYQPKAKGGAK